MKQTMEGPGTGARGTFKERYGSIRRKLKQEAVESSVKKSYKAFLGEYKRKGYPEDKAAKMAKLSAKIHNIKLKGVSPLDVMPLGGVAKAGVKVIPKAVRASKKAYTVMKARQAAKFSKNKVARTQIGKPPTKSANQLKRFAKERRGTTDPVKMMGKRTNLPMGSKQQGLSTVTRQTGKPTAKAPTQLRPKYQQKLKATAKRQSDIARGKRALEFIRWRRQDVGRRAIEARDGVRRTAPERIAKTAEASKAVKARLKPYKGPQAPPVATKAPTGPSRTAKLKQGASNMANQAGQAARSAGRKAKSAATSMGKSAKNRLKGIGDSVKNNSGNLKIAGGIGAAGAAGTLLLKSSSKQQEGKPMAKKPMAKKPEVKSITDLRKAKVEAVEKSQAMDKKKVEKINKNIAKTVKKPTVMKKTRKIKPKYRSTTIPSADLTGSDITEYKKSGAPNPKQRAALLKLKQQYEKAFDAKDIKKIKEYRAKRNEINKYFEKGKKTTRKGPSIEELRRQQAKGFKSRANEGPTRSIPTGRRKSGRGVPDVYLGPYDSPKVHLMKNKRAVIINVNNRYAKYYQSKNLKKMAEHKQKIREVESYFDKKIKELK